MLVSTKRNKATPVFLGTHDGKQETRTSKNEIEQEISLLSAKINKMKKDGFPMIGNLGENMGRNGKKVLRVFNEKTLHVSELSTINYIVTSTEAY